MRYPDEEATCAGSSPWLKRWAWKATSWVSVVAFTVSENLPAKTRSEFSGSARRSFRLYTGKPGRPEAGTTDWSNRVRLSSRTSACMCRAIRLIDAVRNAEHSIASRTASGGKSPDGGGRFPSGSSRRARWIASCSRNAWCRKTCTCTWKAERRARLVVLSSTLLHSLSAAARWGCALPKGFWGLKSGLIHDFMYAIASGSIFWGVRHSLSSRAAMGNFFANVEAPRAVVEPPRISLASLLAIETVIGSMGTTTYGLATNSGTSANRERV